ncbi:COP9 signalosome complex subunit 2-like [Schistocerca gregaria]|uniref:COP9 signalosome complex subunit 2-like n=1 Tax=Schistocerca gregaria TaxID=7010 RepID=UPI00211E74E4|nr:COP9 signalosome complex subunit 2-like [Schistocerca gregaria]
MADYDDSMLFSDDSGDEEKSDLEENDPIVKAEHLYFEAKDLESEDPEEMLRCFELVLETEPSKGKWGFKSLKKMIKILYTLGRMEEVLKNFNRLLKEYSNLIIGKEEAMNKLLDFIRNSPHITEIYTQTFKELEKRGNMKAMLRLELRYLKVLLDARNYELLEKKIVEVHQHCLLPDGEEDLSKSNELIEMYALQICMYSARGNTRVLKELYEKALRIRGLCNPRVTGVIYQCGGKMYMKEKNWLAANTDFFEAFKNFDDAGARAQSTECLRYLVLTNMLSGSTINPFHEQRARSYQDCEEIEAMTSLVEAYQRHDITEFKKRLQASSALLLSDPLIAEHLNDLMKALHCGALVERVRPYTRIALSYIASELSVPVEEVEALVIELILDGKIKGKVDQVTRVLRLESRKVKESQFEALTRLSASADALNEALFSNLR